MQLSPSTSCKATMLITSWSRLSDNSSCGYWLFVCGCKSKVLYCSSGSLLSNSFCLHSVKVNAFKKTLSKKKCALNLRTGCIARRLQSDPQDRFLRSTEMREVTVMQPGRGYDHWVVFGWQQDLVLLKQIKLLTTFPFLLLLFIPNNDLAAIENIHYCAAEQNMKYIKDTIYWQFNNDFISMCPFSVPIRPRSWGLEPI